MTSGRYIAFALILGVCFVGCETGNSIRGTNIQVYGTYTGAPLANTPDGVITYLQLIQDGDELQGIDNFNRVFRGQLNEKSTTECEIFLTGHDAKGEITLTGIITGTSSSWLLAGSIITARYYVPMYGSTGRATNIKEMTEEQKKTYNARGCCSSHDGIKGTYDTTSGALICNDGTTSPGCNINDK